MTNAVLVLIASELGSEGWYLTWFIAAWEAREGLTGAKGNHLLERMSSSSKTVRQGRLAQVRRWVERLSANRRRLATVGAGLLAVGVGYHVVFGPNGLIVYEQKRHETRTLDTEMKQLSGENDVLKGHVGRLESDPNAIEHEAREQLHYTRPGEVIYRLEGPSGSSAK